MFRRICCYITIVLVAIYLAQSMFLGVAHQHSHHSHSHHAGANPVECIPVDIPSSETDDHSSHSHDDPAETCAICRYLALPGLPPTIPVDLSVDPVEEMQVEFRPCYVSHPHFALPRPRSPPATV